MEEEQRDSTDTGWDWFRWRLTIIGLPLLVAGLPIGIYGLLVADSATDRLAGLFAGIAMSVLGAFVLWLSRVDQKRSRPPRAE